ncbi:homoserine O-acetyltransferase MetX [Alicyclobacillus herbarius]|uniref:homoserine O-acetyltransferase MetX n=1 Tax=Alicyclobacillus herbarius TaxID=122960 RepID=UPI00041A14A5|nr:homoserine O-acetyltransferase [Alicyclobacillus herbarius]
MTEKQPGLATAESDEDGCRTEVKQAGIAAGGVEHQSGVVTLGDFSFECGQTLPMVQVAFETWGRLNAARDNAVVVCHALTGDAHAAAGAEGQAGWWNGLIGPGCFLDTTRFFVICSNVLGGCSGSTGPATIGPDDRPYALRFPLITVRDMVKAQMRLLDALGVRRVQLVVGGSLGGMQAWEWPLLDPERVLRSAIIAADARFSALAIGYNEVMRQAIVGDPAWQHGNYYGTGKRPTHGLGLARSIAMLTYRTDTLFEARFGREEVTPPAPTDRPGSAETGTFFENEACASSPLAAFTQPLYQVESYLRHHGRKLDARFDANSYLYLTRAMDSHDIGRGRGGLLQALENLKASVFLVGIDTDYLYSVSALEHTAQLAQDVGVRLDFHVVSSDFGHDAFLAEPEKLGQVLKGVWQA